MRRCSKQSNSIGLSNKQIVMLRINHGYCIFGDAYQVVYCHRSSRSRINLDLYSGRVCNAVLINQDKTSGISPFLYGFTDNDI